MKVTLRLPIDYVTALASGAVPELALSPAAAEELKKVVDDASEMHDVCYYEMYTVRMSKREIIERAISDDRVKAGDGMNAGCRAYALQYDWLRDNR